MALRASLRSWKCGARGEEADKEEVDEGEETLSERDGREVSTVLEEVVEAADNGEAVSGILIEGGRAGVRKTARTSSASEDKAALANFP